MVSTLEISADRLHGQWAASPKLRAYATVAVDLFRSLAAAADDLADMRNRETAEGVWLDEIGRRLGAARPSVDSTTDRFGFDLSGVGFDQAPFADELGEATQPMGDSDYRRLLEARGLAILSDGTLTDFAACAAVIDADATVTDNRDMTAVIVTARPELMTAAVATGALPVPATVTVTITDRV